MKVFTPDNGELMEIREIQRHGNSLAVRGKIMGSMPMTAIITPQEARRALKLLDVRTFLFLLTLLFRRNKQT
jgi:hypothetical protein